MNRIYKLIWSKVKNCYVVTSELAKNHGKSGVRSKKSSVLKSSAVLSLSIALALGITGQAFAQDIDEDLNVAGDLAVTGGATVGETLAVGESLTVTGDATVGGNLAVTGNTTIANLQVSNGIINMGTSQGGYPHQIVIDTKSNIALGDSYSSSSFFQGNTSNAVAIGSFAVINNTTGGVAIGNSASVYNGGKVAIGGGAYATGRNAINIGGRISGSYSGNANQGFKADGEDDTVIGGAVQGFNNTAIGSGSNAGYWSGSYGRPSQDNTAIGYNAIAEGERETAVGSQSHAGGWNSTAVGYRAETVRSDSVAVGANSRTNGDANIAIGPYASTYSYSSIAVGLGAQANTDDSISMGRSAKVEYIESAQEDETRRFAQNAIAIGQSSIARGLDATAVGRNSVANRRNSTAYGNNSHANGWNSIAIGNKSIAGLESNIEEITYDGRTGETIVTIKDAESGQSAVAVGNRARAIEEYSTAVGASTNAEGWHSVAVGDSNSAVGRFSTAMGAGWSIYTVDEDDNDNTEAPREYESIGANQATGDYSTAVGYGNATTGDNSTALGMQNAVSGNNSIGIGTKNIIGSVTKPGDTKELTADTDKGDVTGFAFGNENEITGNNSIAIGVGNKVSGENSGAIGDPNIVDGNESYVVGNNSKVDSDASESFIMGNNSTTSAKRGLIFGNSSKVSGEGGIVAGSKSEVSAKDSIAIGNNAKATMKNSVALGSGSETTHMGGLNGKKEIEIPGTNTKYTNVTGESPVGTVSVGKPGKERTITNVAAGRVGPGSTDAINGSELYAVEQQVVANSADIVNLSNRIDKVGAGAAALAGLHPLDFDPDEKWDFAASVGSYKSEQAVAIGAFYRPNEDTMFSIAGTIGDGRNMVNVGVSWKFGQKNRISANRISSAKEIIELRKNQENVHSFLADAVAGNQLDLSKIQLFPDVEENHWAYDYVATMAGNGVLEGYPDGYFKGNRNMTRYEMAAVLYRLMQNGARLSDRALTEFAPELDRIRVDTITKHKDGTPHIQRVRTIKERVDEKSDLSPEKAEKKAKIKVAEKPME
jgi:autotransporter adhesin